MQFKHKIVIMVLLSINQSIKQSIKWIRWSVIFVFLIRFEGITELVCADRLCWLSVFFYCWKYCSFIREEHSIKLQICPGKQCPKSDVPLACEPNLRRPFPFGKALNPSSSPPPPLPKRGLLCRVLLLVRNYGCERLAHTRISKVKTVSWFHASKWSRSIDWLIDWLCEIHCWFISFN